MGSCKPFTILVQLKAPAPGATTPSGTAIKLRYSIHVNSNKQCNVSIIVRIHYCIRLRCIGNVVDCIEVVRAHNTISLSNRIYDRNLFLIT